VQNSSDVIDSSRMGKKSKKTTIASASPATGQAVADPGTKKKGLISDTTCSRPGKVPII